LKFKLYDLPAFLCIAVSIGVSVFLLLFCLGEQSFDRFFDDYKNIYRIEVSSGLVSDGDQIPITDPDLSQLLENQPEALSWYKVGSVENFREVTIFEDDTRKNKLDIVKTFAVDPTIFEIFGLKLTKGSKWDPYRKDIAFVSKEFAINIFGTDDKALGERLYLGSSEVFTITGVYDTFPNKSHISFDIATPRTPFRLPSIDSFKAEDFANAPTGVQAAVIDTLTYVKTQPAGLERLEVAISRVAKAGARPTLSGMKLVPISKLYFFGGYTKSAVLGDMAVYYTALVTSLIFFIIAAGQLRLLLENGKPKRDRITYIKKSLGFTPLELLTLNWVYVASAIAIMTIISTVVTLLLDSQLRTILGLEGALINAVVRSSFSNALTFSFVFNSLCFAFAVNFKELRAFFIKPNELLESRKPILARTDTFLKVIIVVNFAVLTTLISVVQTVHVSITAHKTAVRGFETEIVHLIEGLSQNDDARKVIEARQKLRFYADKLRSKFGVTNVGLISTDFETLDLGKELFTFENGRKLRLQTVYASKNIFELLGVNILNFNDYEDIKNLTSTDVLISSSLHNYLNNTEGFDLNSSSLTHRLGARFKVAGATDDVILVDPDFADKNTVFIFDPKKASSLVVKIPEGDNIPSASELIELGFPATMKTSTLNEVLLRAIVEKINRRNFLLTVAFIILIASIISTFYMFILVLDRARKEIAIRQVCGSTLSKLLLLWIPRMLGPVGTGVVVGAFIVKLSSNNPEMPAWFFSNRYAQTFLLTFTGAILLGLTVLMVCLYVMSRQIDLRTLRQNT